ncbi:MAG: cytidylate kinase-like family protein [Lacipirellulaceae bacterium]
MTTYANARGAALERAYQHWRERGALLQVHPKSAKELPSPVTIAISREKGTGGEVVARRVAQELGWPCYDRELVETIAEDSGVRADLLEKLDEKRPNWIAECLESFSDGKHMSGAGYAKRLRDTLLALYCHGNCVILGRGAAQVLPPANTLRVCLIAPKLFRIREATGRLGVSEKAEKEVAHADRDRVDFVKSYFHKDPKNLRDYDVVLDASRLGEETMVRLLVAAAKAKQPLQDSTST